MRVYGKWKLEREGEREREEEKLAIVQYMS